MKQTIKIILGSSVLTSFLLSMLFLFFETAITERIELSFEKDKEDYISDLAWETKAKERAEKVAEYLSLARSLTEESSEQDFRKANELSWELAMWLPSDIYKQVVFSIVKPTLDTNELTTIIEVRKLLLQDKSGNLTPDDIAHHAPGIGNKSLQ